jgi:flagellar biosynthesis/type III secretory pathway protein FliH
VAAEFVALADVLRARASGTAEAAVEPAARVAAESFAQDHPLVPESDAFACAAVREARLFRARLADAFDDAAARLLRELASGVLARELRLAPCDLAELVRRARERMPVVRVRVAACDVARVAGALSRGGVPVVEDSVLASGDAVVEVAGGALDARLGVRLATVLEAFA